MEGGRREGGKVGGREGRRGRQGGWVLSNRKICGVDARTQLPFFPLARAKIGRSSIMRTEKKYQVRVAYLLLSFRPSLRLL